MNEETPMIATSARARGASASRKLATLVRLVERAVDQALGTDDAAARIRRYVADHDAPPDDRAAFARLCAVVFAQGIGFETVSAKARELETAFCGFAPDVVAAFDDHRIAALGAAPIIRNIAKITACVENARRWISLAQTHGTYLARVAQTAAADEPAAGWAAVSAMLQADFARFGQSTAAQTLKRWGFFTAVAHPGARRVIERLGFAVPETQGPSLQRLIGSTAVKLGRDPYAVEAVLALFAGIGPCKKLPACTTCALSDRCPSAHLAHAAEG